MSIAPAVIVREPIAPKTPDAFAEAITRVLPSLSNVSSLVSDTKGVANAAFASAGIGSDPSFTICTPRVKASSFARPISLVIDCVGDWFLPAAAKRWSAEAGNVQGGVTRLDGSGPEQPRGLPNHRELGPIAVDVKAVRHTVVPITAVRIREMHDRIPILKRRKRRQRWVKLGSMCIRPGLIVLAHRIWLASLASPGHFEKRGPSVISGGGILDGPIEAVPGSSKESVVIDVEVIVLVVEDHPANRRW